MFDLNITLAPRWECGTVASMDVSVFVSADAVQPDGPALDYAEQAFGGLCPFPEYDRLEIVDDLGNVPFEFGDAPSEYDMAIYKGIYLKRKPQGILRWSYCIYPRVLPDDYESSPYYDFRNEPGGLNGSGLFSLILPKREEAFRVHFRWDLAAMPVDARAIWSYGEGEVETAGTPFELRFTLFNIGVMESYEDGDFGVYWFGEPNFEVCPIAKRLYEVFCYMKDYFEDEEPSFRVFLRRDPFRKSGGGSACPHAFISGYYANGEVDTERWFNVLVHEMTHSWPFMDMAIAENAWYTEGIVEYYCTMLPYRAGITDASYTVKRINEKAVDRYYDNACRELSNSDIPKIQWQDRRAQTVPYGRGFIYLANVDAKLRRIGKGSIDDIAKKYIMSKKSPLTPELWAAFIEERLGEEGIREYEEMKTGKLLVPDQGIFGPEFRTIETVIELDGKDAVSYRWELGDETIV
jgi:hypothetical protein